MELKLLGKYKGLFKVKTTKPLRGSLGGFGSFHSKTIRTPFRAERSSRWRSYRE